MAFLLGTEKVTYEVASKVVLEDVSVGVDSGSRIGIVGRNGDGKSTLLKLLDGKIEPDSGRVIKTAGTNIGFLGQGDDLDDSVSVEVAIFGDMPKYAWASDQKIREILNGLLVGIDLDSIVQTLSGGQRRRVALANVLVGDWDILMLDEPTNHLDIKAIGWLANHLKNRWKQGSGALLTVTHDRWFLDEVCNEMWEVHDRKVQPFEGGFSAYIMQRVERDRQAAVAEQKRKNLLRRELAWLSRGARARATKPKFHVAAAQALIADVPELRDEIELKRMAMKRIGKQVVDIENASVAFDGHEVLKNIELNIGPGDRIGIVGGNGVGKTTFLRLVSGGLDPTSGKVKTGSTVSFAILSQHMEELDEFKGDLVRQVVGRYSRRVMLDGKENTPSQLLEKLGFDKNDLNEPVDDLSGGQRRRLALMMILLDEPNVLILDEPGNDLDVDMLAAVENLLDGWPGTLLLVTHDRYLMERVTDHQYALIDGRLRHLPRGIDEYIEIMEKADRLKETDPDVQSKVSGGSKADSGESDASQDRHEQRNGSSSKNTATSLSNNELRALKKTMSSCEKKIETAKKKLEAAKLKLEEANQSDYKELVEIQDEIDDLEIRIAALESEWLEAAEKIG